MLRVIEYFAKSLKITQELKIILNGPFDSLGMVSYSHSIVTLWLHVCIISEIKRDIGGNCDFSYPPAFDALALGGPRRNIVIRFDVEKLEWYGYSTVKKFEDMFSRFHRIPACDGQTDSDRHTFCNRIVRAKERCKLGPK